MERHGTVPNSDKPCFQMRTSRRECTITPKAYPLASSWDASESWQDLVRASRSSKIQISPMVVSTSNLLDLPSPSTRAQRLLRYHAHQKSVPPSVNPASLTSGTLTGNTSANTRSVRPSLARHPFHGTSTTPPPTRRCVSRAKTTFSLSSQFTHGTRFHGPHTLRPIDCRQCDGQESTGLEPLANQQLVSLAFSACYSFSFSEPETRAGGATAT